MVGGRWQVAGGGWWVAVGQWLVVSGKWQVAGGRWWAGVGGAQCSVLADAYCLVISTEYLVHTPLFFLLTRFWDVLLAFHAV